MKKIYFDFSIADITNNEPNVFFGESTYVVGDCEKINKKTPKDIIQNRDFGQIDGEFKVSFFLTKDESNMGFYEPIDFIQNEENEKNTSDYAVQKSQIKYKGSSRFDDIGIYGNPNIGSSYSNNSFFGVLIDNNIFVDYVLDGELLGNNGYLQGTGIQIREYKNKKDIYYDNDLMEYVEVDYVEGKYYTEGNTSDLILKNDVKNDIYFGYDELSEIANDINITRGQHGVFEKYYQMQEISSYTQIIENNLI